MSKTIVMFQAEVHPIPYLISGRSHIVETVRKRGYCPALYGMTEDPSDVIVYSTGVSEVANEGYMVNSRNGIARMQKLF